MQKATELINFLFGHNFLKLDDISLSRIQKFYDGYLWLELIEDLNKEIFIELCCKDIDNIRDWYDMDIVRFLILNSPYKVDGNFHFEDLSKFFMNNYTSIRDAFNECNYANSELELKKLQEERGAALFGSYKL